MPATAANSLSQIEINIAKCAALTAGWHLVDPETLEPIDEPCTIENARELYSLPLTTWIWLQPWAAANNHVNFIKRSAKHLFDYAEWNFRNSRRVSDGSTEGEHRKSAAAQFARLGIKPKQRHHRRCAAVSRAAALSLELVQRDSGGCAGQRHDLSGRHLGSVDCWTALMRQEIAPREAATIITLGNIWAAIMAEKAEKKLDAAQH